MESACLKARGMFLAEGEIDDEVEQEEEPIRLPMTTNPVQIALGHYPVSIEGEIGSKLMECIMEEAGRRRQQTDQVHQGDYGHAHAWTGPRGSQTRPRRKEVDGICVLKGKGHVPR